MLNIIRKIFRDSKVTLKYPKQPMNSVNFSGLPEIVHSKCIKCKTCVGECPTDAISENSSGELTINAGKCIFCFNCIEVCRKGAIIETDRFELAFKSKNPISEDDDKLEKTGHTLRSKIIGLFGRSLQIREVDAGSCNGCDYEINALNNPFNDIERFGISFTASPRHADMLLVTGVPVRNMEEALLKTYEAMPHPKIVVAVGACAISGGIFRGSYASCSNGMSYKGNFKENASCINGMSYKGNFKDNASCSNGMSYKGNFKENASCSNIKYCRNSGLESGVSNLLPVDVFIPGCPPRPQAILHGILMALDRLPRKK